MYGQDEPAVTAGAGRFPGADVEIAGIAPVRYGPVILCFILQIGDVGLHPLGFEPLGGLGALALFKLRVRRTRPVAVVDAFHACGWIERPTGTDSE